jgi:hypothetical protein
MFLRIIEISATIGVLVSVIVLIFQVNQTSMAMKLSAYDEAISAILEWRYVTTNDANFNEIVYRAIVEGEEDKLSPAEMYRFTNHMSSLWLIYDRAYWANEYGQMGRNEWERFSRNICSSLPPKLDRFELLEGGITKQFSAYIKSSCPQFTG